MTKNSYLESVLLILSLGFMVLLNLNQIYSNDTWWHTEMGRWMLEHRRVFTQDVYSATALGAPLMAHAWLSDVLFYLIADRDGVRLTVLKIFVMVIVSLALYWGILRKDWSQRYTFAVWLVLAYLLSFQSEVRPQIFGLMGSTGLIIALERWWESR